MKTSSVIAMFIASFVLLAQSLIGSYYLIVNNIYPVFIAFDVVLFLLIVCAHKPQHAGPFGGVIWLLYAWIYYGKILLVYYKLYAKNFGVEGVQSTDEIIVGDISFFIALFLIPIFYGVLSLRAGIQLYHSWTSKAAMLHADLAVHVMIDLLDIDVAVLYSKRYFSNEAIKKWFSNLWGGSIVTGMLFHSFSFPTSGELNSTRTGKKESIRRADLFLTRRYAALVGMFVVDIPLLSLRSYCIYKKLPTDAFLIKNVLFLLLQAFRLNQCRLAEKDALTNRDNDFAEADSGNDLLYATPLLIAASGKAPPDKKNSQIVTTSPVGALRRQGSAGALRRQGSASAFLNVPKMTSKIDFGSRRDRQMSWNRDSAGPRPFSSSFRITGQGRGGFRNRTTSALHDMNEKEDMYNASLAGQGEREITPMRGVQEVSAKESDEGSSPGNDESDDSSAFTKKTIDSILDELTKTRKLPVTGQRVNKVFAKVWSCLQKGGSHGLSGMLDDALVFSYWKQLRLTFPIALHFVSQIAMIAICSKTTIRYQEPFTLSSFGKLPTDQLAGYGIVAGGTFLMLFFFAGLAPLLDVIFVSIFWGIRMCSFFMTFLIFRDTHILIPISFLKSQYFWIVHFVLFGVLPIWYTVKALYVIFSALAGHTHIYYFTPEAADETEIQLITRPINSLPQDDQRRRATCVSTSIVLVFLNCRHMVAPISLGELLISPDMIKDVRLLDQMLLRSWIDLLVVCCFKGFSILLFYDWPYCVVFGLHVFFLGIYIIFAQAVRLVALRRFEVKAVLREVVKSATAPEKALLNRHNGATGVTGQRFGEDKKQSRQNVNVFIGLADIVLKYEKFGFFTSPGTLFPPLF